MELPVVHFAAVQHPRKSNTLLIQDTWLSDTHGSLATLLPFALPLVKQWNISNVCSWKENTQCHLSWPLKWFLFLWLVCLTSQQQNVVRCGHVVITHFMQHLPFLIQETNHWPKTEWLCAFGSRCTNFLLELWPVGLHGKWVGLAQHLGKILLNPKNSAPVTETHVEFIWSTDKFCWNCQDDIFATADGWVLAQISNLLMRKSNQWQLFQTQEQCLLTCQIGQKCKNNPLNFVNKKNSTCVVHGAGNPTLRLRGWILWRRQGKATSYPYTSKYFRIKWKWPKRICLPTSLWLQKNLLEKESALMKYKISPHLCWAPANLPVWCQIPRANY